MTATVNFPRRPDEVLVDPDQAMVPEDRPTAYEPVSVVARYGPPRATVKPNPDLNWARRLAPLVFARKKHLVLGLIASVFTLVIQIAIPRTAGLAIDAISRNASGSLAPYAFMLAGLAAARATASYVYRYQLQRSSLGIETDMRNMIYRHLTRLSFSFFDRVQSGQLISRANSDIRAVQMFLGFAPTVAISILTFFAAFGFMLSIHVRLALVAGMTMPFVYLTGRTMRTKMFPISWMVQARTASLATIVEENVTGVRVVKSHAAEAQQISLLQRAAERWLWASNLQVDIRARFQPMMQNFPRIALAFVLLYGGWLAIHDQVTVGELVTFNGYVFMLQAPFMMLGFLMVMAQRSSASAKRILEIIDQTPEIQDRPGAFDLVDPQGDVRFEEVSFGYGAGENILTDFNLHISPGETVALVGRTGCGKSTVARLLARFYDVREGRVLMDGNDIRDLTVPSLRAAVGLVLDEPFLFSEPIRDNINYGRPTATQEEVEAAARAAGAEDFILELPAGYDTVIGERGYTLSGGQRQRIAIARTLLANPPVLVLDDATSSVDVQREQEIHGALATLMEGRTTLIIAHRLSTISLAKRVLLMEGGRIIADGTHEELMATVPQYAEVLARAEDEWQAAHNPPKPSDLDDPLDSDDEPDLPPQLRALKHLAAARSNEADTPRRSFEPETFGGSTPGAGGGQ
ncbi:MAG TPA: ABC transporter ATP-binding protein [Acidimicrobiales bacterium]|nr:ABC transporter ATP-binding protein [Acidimicrobiales bacterium]